MACGRCWKCKEGTGCIRSIQYAPSAMPTRHPTIVKDVAKEKQWDRDIPAYKRLRNNGIQPKRIDDSAELEKRAENAFEVEMAQIVPKNRVAQVKEGMAIAKEWENAAPVVKRD